MTARNRRSIKFLPIVFAMSLAPLAVSTGANAQGLRADVDALQTQVSTLQDQVSALRTAVASLQVPTGPFSAASLSGTYVFHFSGIALDAAVTAYNLFAVMNIGGVLNLGCSEVQLDPIITAFTCTSNIFTGTHFGQVSYPFPVVQHQFGVGTLVADGAGNLVGSGTCHNARPVNAVVANLAPPLDGTATPPRYSIRQTDQTVSFTGTYTVNANGTGSMTLQGVSCGSGSSGSAVLSLVLGSGGRLGTFWEVDATHGAGVSGTFARQ